MEIKSSSLALPTLYAASPHQSRNRVSQRLESSSSINRPLSTRIQTTPPGPAVTSRHTSALSGSTLLGAEQPPRLQATVVRRPGFNSQHAINTYREIDNSRSQTGNLELLNRIDTRA